MILNSSNGAFLGFFCDLRPHTKSELRRNVWG